MGYRGLIVRHGNLNTVRLTAVTYRDGSVRWGDGLKRVDTAPWERHNIDSLQ